MVLDFILQLLTSVTSSAAADHDSFIWIISTEADRSGELKLLSSAL